MLHPIPLAVDGGPQFPPRVDTRSDGELMRRVLAEDAGAVDALYDRHAPAVYGLAYRMLRERSAAEDVVQETFMALWRGRDGYRPERGSLGTWLLTITRNRAIDAIRRGRAHLYVELESEHDQEAPDRTDEEALRHLEAVSIGLALRTLPAFQREALELAYFGGLTQTEIAARLGIPLGTVKSRLRLALRKLGTRIDAPAGHAAEV